MSIKYNIHKNILGGAESICINTVIDGVFHGIPIVSDNRHYQQYLEDIKTLHRNSAEQDFSQEEVNGVFISKKLLTRESNRSCPVCNTYSFKSKDDVYMSKFECCEGCYIQWVEDREERWILGWRPNNG